MAKKQAEKELIDTNEESMQKVVALATGTTLATTNDELTFDDFVGNINAGLENANVDAFAIPFLLTLQKISPQCEESDAKYIKGARGGMLGHSVSGRLWEGKPEAENKLIILPVDYQQRFIHWGARGTDNAGFKGEHLPEEAAVMKADGTIQEIEGRWYFPLPGGEIDPKKCDMLVDTRNHFAIWLDDKTGDYGQILVSLSSTQIKKSKQLMTLVGEVKVRRPDGTGVTPPTWMNRVQCSTVLETNEKGSWAGIKFSLDGLIKSKELFKAGKKFYDAIKAGTAGPVRYEEPTDTVDDRI